MCNSMWYVVGMESMLDIKGWLITKCRANSSTVQRNQKDPCTVGSALTPDSIPEFPLSMAAMSLPHFRSRTTFGFSTLSQSPHTRRKESLFHIQGNGLSSHDSQRLKSLEALSIRGRPDMMDDIIRFSDSEISTKKHTPSVIVTPSASPVCTSVMLSPERQPNHLLATSPNK